MLSSSGSYPILTVSFDRCALLAAGDYELSFGGCFIVYLLGYLGSKGHWPRRSSPCACFLCFLYATLQFDWMRRVRISYFVRGLCMSLSNLFAFGPKHRYPITHFNFNKRSNINLSPFFSIYRPAQSPFYFFYNSYLLAMVLVSRRGR